MAGRTEERRSVMQAIGDVVAADRKRPGGMHMPAMLVKGLEELRAAVAPESNIVQPTNPGILGSWTPGEVAEQREGDATVSFMNDLGRQFLSDESSGRAAPADAERDDPLDKARRDMRDQVKGKGKDKDTGLEP